MTRSITAFILVFTLGCSESKIIPTDLSPTDTGPVAADVDGAPPDDGTDVDGSPPDDTGEAPMDTDGDGVIDAEDACPGHDDHIDTDGDGVADGCDPCPVDNPDDSDGDGVCDAEDACPDHDDTIDVDADGVADGCDACPLDATDDIDGDGVCDSEDVCDGASDLMDMDGDGTPDGCDVCPMDALDDTDGDGACDSDDVCPGHDDFADADGDSFADGCDVCPGHDDTLDGDGDGVADGCDACPLDALDDSDGDGSCDSDDACPGHDDGLDGDGDGVADGCDNCPLDALDDSDGDGSCDSDDACPGHDDGLDGDGDGVADGCDACPLDALDDSDGDGSCDSDDVCPGSDDALDTDGDGVADGCDNCPLDFPDDADGDGVCDSDPIPLPNGLIVAYTGESIPDGWALCDGSGGTPDLRGRFVLGVLDAEPGLTGGSDAHEHEAFTDVTVMSTSSTSPGTRSCSPPGCWCTNKAQHSNHSHDMTHDHTIDPDASLPPYVEVLYLMNVDAEALPAQSVMGFAALPEVGDEDGSWRLDDTLTGRFLRGAPDDVPGATGGSIEHDHLGYSGMESATGSYPGSYGMTVTAHGASATDLSHSHPYEHDHSMTSDEHLPPHTRLLWVTPEVPDRLPIPGAMAMWSGNTADIPRGWVLADGSDGTIDMSGFFVMGASSPDDVGVEGGSTEHTHSVGSDGGGWTGSNSGGNGQCSGGGSLMDFHQHEVPSHDHGMAPDANEPPYYTLAVIVYEG
jgi:hypothetical protein